MTPTSQMNQRPQTETRAACSTTAGSLRVPGVTHCRRTSRQALSKPGLQVTSHEPGCALTLRVDLLQYLASEANGHATDNIHQLFVGYEIKKYQPD